MSTTIITKPKVEIAPELLSKLRTQTEEAGQVILHFLHYNWSFYPSKIRIWPTSYLFDIGSNHRSELVHAENITWYPEWMDVPPMSVDFFTLIFSGLPRSCSIFDFEEHCDNQAGAFVVKNIPRNDTDVYYLRLG